MFRYCLLVLCVLASSAVASVISNPSIVQKSVSRRVSNPFGIVEGIEVCEGAEGQLLQVRITDCTKIPCDVVAGRTYIVEIDFIPKSSHPVINLKVVLVHNEEAYSIVDVDVPDSAVVGGLTYTFLYNMDVRSEFMGLSDLWVGMLGDEVLELCGIASLNTIPAN